MYLKENTLPDGFVSGEISTTSDGSRGWSTSQILITADGKVLTEAVELTRAV